MTAASLPLPGDLGPVAAQNAHVVPRPTRPPLAAPLRLKTEGQASVSPPKAERLPSFRQLSKIADAAGDDQSRPVPFPPPAQPIYAAPSMTHQSPIMSHQPYAHCPPLSSSMGSIGSQMGYGFPPQPSPTSAQSEAFYSTSPTAAMMPSAHNSFHRRQSFPVPNHQFPPSLTSMGTSSSVDSYGHHSSVGDISTTQTTPLDGPGAPLEQSKSYPLLPNLSTSAPVSQGPWHCDHPGCSASPFPTQYLLKYIPSCSFGPTTDRPSSHATSHSPLRPHYCPVPGCPRGEGGKGFKRKNEMIRHGLTHNTPGYVCPFCPDQAGHRYPRPDNLQRHVRVHHVDKDRDDPALREVLSQRNVSTGAGRGRRRRTGP